jgi:hypothetical protein
MIGEERVGPGVRCWTKDKLQVMVESPGIISITYPME